MNAINRLMTNLCSANVEESKAFYVALFDFEVIYDSDWFIQLKSKGAELELGIIDRHHELVPEVARSISSGFYLTIFVDDVMKVYEQAREMGASIVEDPKDTFYGQKRMLLEDPNGVIVDVSSLIGRG